MVKAILWDMDGTLLDFHAAERAAIFALFEKYGLGECTEEMLQRYMQINTKLWRQLEKNEVNKREVLVGRYEKFFGEYGLDTSLAEAFNSDYQLALGDTIVFRDNSYELVKKLKGKVKQYMVSNGTVIAQEKKLAKSGFGELMDEIFLSEAVGAEKPNMAFFDKVFEVIGKPENKSDYIIIGDALSSDIKGGNNAGILTCWYNPHHLQLSDEYQVDYEIENLNEVPKILGFEGL